MKTRMITKWVFLAMLLGNLLPACTKYDTPISVEEGLDDVGGRAETKNYVLWINLEGAGGGDLAKNAFPDDGTVKGLLSHSYYAWSGLEAEHKDDNYRPSAGEENAVACASMLTGNIPMRHGIQDNDYLTNQIFDPDFDESIKAYPGFFQYITDYDKSMHTLAVTPWKIQNEKLLDKATTNVTTASDEETLATALQQIDEESNRVIYLSFRGVLDAAVSGGGWNESNGGYKEAMKKMDGYIGQLLEAVRARTNYYYEDWLIIITSNHGGTTDGQYGGNSLEERNMFGIFHYEHFSVSKEMNPGLIEDEVLWFDKSYKGIVVDSITRTSDLKGVKTMRQIYSIDTLNNGMTVEYIMAARPSASCSYVTSNQDGLEFLSKSSWKMRTDHTYASATGNFWGVDDGTSNVQWSNFLNPMIHTLTSTMKFYDSELFQNEVTVDEKEDEWGNVTPASRKKEYRVRGKLASYTYYDGLRKTSSKKVTDTDIDKKTADCIDNTNLVLSNKLRNAGRYILELRIWNKTMTDDEVKAYSNRLNLSAEEHPNLIGYWKFYKGQLEETVDELGNPVTIVKNQVKKVKKYVLDEEGNRVERELPTEGLQICTVETVNENGKNVEKQQQVLLSEMKYTTLCNTCYQTMENEGRMMESVLPVPALLQWLGISFPLESTRDQGASAFKTSKLDGVAYTLDGETNSKVWRGMILGDYSRDLEWRDRE